MQPQEQPLRLSLEDLKRFASVLTDGSLMKAATLQVIAEQEERGRRQEGICRKRRRSDGG
ncbi:hypothetical protein BKK81_10385 [Cupriavidus sp. USMAHM13]|nr:hypothetical protein BKK81_10385 [Cupriavidus sp. USMAHM13]